MESQESPRTAKTPAPHTPLTPIPHTYTHPGTPSWRTHYWQVFIAKGPPKKKTWLPPPPWAVQQKGREPAPFPPGKGFGVGEVRFPSAAPPNPRGPPGWRPRAPPTRLGLLHPRQRRSPGSGGEKRAPGGPPGPAQRRGIGGAGAHKAQAWGGGARPGPGHPGVPARALTHRPPGLSSGCSGGAGSAAPGAPGGEMLADAAASRPIPGSGGGCGGRPASQAAPIPPPGPARPSPAQPGPLPGAHACKPAGVCVCVRVCACKPLPTAPVRPVGGASQGKARPRVRACVPACARVPRVRGRTRVAGALAARTALSWRSRSGGLKFVPGLGGGRAHRSECAAGVFLRACPRLPPPRWVGGWATPS